LLCLSIGNENEYTDLGELLAPSFGDHKCEALAARLPELRVWDIYNALGPLPAGLTFFSKHFCKLEWLHVGIKSNLGMLQTMEAPMLPSLAMHHPETPMLVHTW
jgi:hypothetical protein